jgi:hypothetical protein
MAENNREEMLNEIVRLEQNLEAMKAERDALAAQVEALRDAGNEVYEELQQWALTESHEETSRVFRTWLKARKQTPAACLAQVRAEAVSEFAEFLFVKKGLNVKDIAKTEAERIGQEVK